MEVVLGMFFFIFSNADVQFAEKELIWKTYTTKKALPSTCQVEIIDQKEFAKATLDENIQAFVMHISSLGSRISIHPAREAQLPLLITEKVTMPVEYSDFADVFLEKSANIFPERTGANEHAIKLEEDKQPSYWPMYSLQLIKLKTFKTYIETNLANVFIRLSKSPVCAPILFVRKPNSSFCLYVNYQGLNNLTIKNRYPLLLIDKFLD